MVRVSVVFIALVVTFPARPGAQKAFDPCAIEGVSRIVAVGDVHGAYAELVRILRAARVIDARDRWIGGATHLVQTGDLLDRGAGGRRAIDLLRKLEREAPRRKGRVVALMGNHETMRLGGVANGNPVGEGFLRDMSLAELDLFRTARSTEIRDQVRARWMAAQRAAADANGAPLDEAPLVARFDAQAPLGYIEMLQAFGPSGDYGTWILDRAAAARINGILFLHGGVSPRVAPLGCGGINAGVRADLTTGFDQFRQAPLDLLAGADDGPLWYRGLAREDEEVFAAEVDKILEAVSARAIVIGHTVSETGRIQPRFGGRVVQIDTGMLTSVYKGGRPSALEIAGDKWTAIYEDGRQPIDGPRVTATTGPVAARRAGYAAAR